jgi:hypothetical protein
MRRMDNLRGLANQALERLQAKSAKEFEPPPTVEAARALMRPAGRARGRDVDAAGVKNLPPCAPAWQQKVTV